MANQYQKQVLAAEGWLKAEYHVSMNHVMVGGFHTVNLVTKLVERIQALERAIEGDGPHNRGGGI